MQVISKITKKQKLIDRKTLKKMMKKKLHSPFEKVEMAEYILELAKKLECKIVGIGGKDIIAGQKAALCNTILIVQFH